MMDDAMHEEIAVKRCLDVFGQRRAVAALAALHPPKCSPAPARNSHAQDKIDPVWLQQGDSVCRIRTAWKVVAYARHRLSLS
jgi:hypothetical protein